MEKESTIFDGDFIETSSWDYKSIIKYLMDNFTQIIMFFLVFVIIYVVDRIAHFNAMVYGASQFIPGIPGGNVQNQQHSNQIKHHNPSKRNKKQTVIKK